MQLGMIGLGRRGANLVRRLAKDGHPCVVYDRNRAAVKKLAGRGVQSAASLNKFIAKLSKPCVAWVADALIEANGGRHNPVLDAPDGKKAVR
jgi:Predicted 6-phosphogluconate dehydrogenase